MREFFVKLLSTTDGNYDITLFSVWHFLYIFLIAGAILWIALYLRDKSHETKKKWLDVLAIGTIATYVADFFLMPLARTDFTIDIDKLPFHICTLVAVIIPFVQFNPKFKCIKQTVVCLATVSALMYITYPGSALGGVLPWSYRVVQTFVFHGLNLAWGVISMTSGEVKMSYRNLPQEFLALLCMTVWAAIGNNLYSHGDVQFDWFFITGATFPFIPSRLMPLVTVFSILAMCAIIHTIYHVIVKLRETSLRAVEMKKKAE